MMNLMKMIFMNKLGVHQKVNGDKVLVSSLLPDIAIVRKMKT